MIEMSQPYKDRSHDPSQASEWTTLHTSLVPNKEIGRVQNSSSHSLFSSCRASDSLCFRLLDRQSSFAVYGKLVHNLPSHIHVPVLVDRRSTNAFVF